MRYPLLDKDDIVVNVTEMEIAVAAKWKPPAGLTLGEPSLTANPGDKWDGAAYVSQAAAPRTLFLARDLVALLTPSDIGAINAAAGQSSQIGLWLAMLYSRGEKPIDMDGATFAQAWGALTAVLGQPRADALLAQLRKAG